MNGSHRFDIKEQFSKIIRTVHLRFLYGILNLTCQGCALDSHNTYVVLLILYKKGVTYSF